ncbi:MAG: cadmium-translocating P-type ATPase [Firmicutes bacterium]|nr:cadmium-translocating P-type ATPase [Bacillota bacterium]
MIGRFARPSRLRQVLTLKEFYTTSLGGLLILISYISSKTGAYAYLPEVTAIAAVVLLGGPIVWGALQGLWARQSNVDELVSLAIVASVAVGEYLSAAVVAFIMVLGSLLEKATSLRAHSAIQALVKLKPEQAVILRGDSEVTVPVNQVSPGDLVLIRSGERVPVDGTVVRGEASLNQSSLTGESMPVDKKQGEQVYSGTLLYSGMLVIRAEKTGEASSLGRLIKMVREAESIRAPILRTADRYARYFTPLIIGLSLAVYLFTGETYRAITVLIVGCPCAFILAAPTAITAALGSAARRGVLIKGGALLEELGRVDAVAFDKTGTITTGSPVVIEVAALNDYHQTQVLALAASAEKYSEHPLARAIVKAARDSGIDVREPERFHTIAGRGIEAQVGGSVVFVGSSDDKDDTSSAGTCLVVTLDGQPIGRLLIEDEVRKSAPAAVSDLNNLGIRKAVLLTGDNWRTAAKAAEAVGIKDFRASMLPEQKLLFIREVQQQGYKLAMVGDGINDAPSLAAADIGIAMGAMGTEVAIEASDIALMSDDLDRIPFALRLGRATLNTINFNIAFAVAFNLLAAVVSGMGHLTPIMGAMVHNLGSLFVVGNSARLLGKKV